jgi:outer membrane protein OmpA-like peptidoglycan-associated protein/outer membrane protein assembly factor BamD (BamD/ComL family)
MYKYTELMKYLIILCLLAFSSNTFAQKYSKAFDAMESGNYEKAKNYFDRAEKKLPTLSRYGNARLHAKYDYQGYSLVRAYRYAKYATGNYERSENKEALRNDYQIDNQVLQQLLDSIAGAAYQSIKNKNNPEMLTQYLGIFSESKFADDIRKKRDSLAFFKAEKIEHFRAYQNYASNYPESEYAPEALERFEKLWKQIYEDVLQTGEYLALDKFKSKYSDFPFYDDYSNEHSVLAERGRNLNPENGFFQQYLPKYEKFIKDAAPKDIAFVILQLLMKDDLNNKNYANALDTLKKYESYFDEKPDQINELKKMLAEKSSFESNSQPLKGNVNTGGWEYSASVTGDDKQIVFCGRNREDNLKKGLEDIFIAKKKDGIWQPGVAVTELNTEHLNEAPLFISADGTRMILFSEGNIYYSDKTANGWAEKKIFPQLSNYESWEADAMITADGNAVFFVSDREDNVGMPIRFGKKYHGGRAGNTDIYVSIKQNGQWTKPFNIGTDINTPYSERSPFLHPDMKTLYFSSDGHTGFGQKDVFMTKRLNDSSWTEWTKPVNLGKSINTPDDEWGYKISGDGVKAYFSRFDGKSFNIYKTQLPPEYRPETTTRIYGTVKNTEGYILKSEIIWENLETQKEVGRSNSDPEDGKYIITLPNGKNYGFFVETPGYYPVSGNIDLSETEVMQEIEKNFVLTSLKLITEGDETIPLENVFFAFNSHTLKKESFPELNRFARFVKSQEGKKIEISGHTDNKGSDEYNKSLSLRRAQSVKDYLVSQGCKADKLVVKGYGSEQPIADNSSESGRAKNRRVEFKVLKQ